MLSNPYYEHAILIDPLMFYGRDKEIQDLCESLSKKQCVSIVGQRRIGKSSLLYHLCQESNYSKYIENWKSFVFAYLDLHEVSGTGSNDFFRASSEAIINALGTRLIPPKMVVRNSQDFRDLIEHILTSGFLVVLCMDEFEVLVETLDAESNTNILGFLRSLGNNHRLLMVTSSREPLFKICQTGDMAVSQFWNIFSTKNLGLIPLSEARRLIIEPAKRHGINFTEADIYFVLSNAGPHPFFIQRACFQLFRHYQKQQPSIHDYEAIRSGLYNEAFPFLEEIWKHLSKDEIVFLMGSGTITKEANRGRILDSLKNKGLLDEEGNIYSLIFEDFINEKQNEKRAINNISLKVEGISGFFTGRSSVVQIKVMNETIVELNNILIELEDTATYSVNPEGQYTKKINKLGPLESRILDFTISLRSTGKITLQIKLNNNVYTKHPLEIHAVQDNPYFFGPPIKDQSIFFGREKELQICLNNISRVSGAHTMIIGEQRSGKTSLLNQIQDKLHSPIIPIYISFSGIEREDKLALQWLLNQIIDSLKERKLISTDLSIPPFEYCTDFIKNFKSLIKNLNTYNPNAKLALLLDEAHIMSQINIKFQEVLREAFNQLISSVRVVLACYYDFFEATGNSGSPLQNIFEYIFLRPLEGDDLVRLIVEPASWFNVGYEPMAIKAIQRISGGHPYYCQYLCAKCFDQVQNVKSNTICMKEVTQSEQYVISNEKERFVMGYWERFSQDELIILDDIVNNKKPSVRLGKSLIKLIKKHVVVEKEDRYEFSSDLFEAWVRTLVNEKI